jgi:hypothetical protein
MERGRAMRTHPIFVAIVRAALVSILALTVAVSASTSAAGNMIYNLVSPTNGYVVTGRVTTNGKIGLLTTSDIVEWSFMVTAPNGNSFQQRSSETTGRVSMINATASATEIFLLYPPAPTGGQNNLGFYLGGGWISEAWSLYYITDSQPAGSHGPTEYYNDIIQGFHKPAQTDTMDVHFQQRNEYWSQPPATPFVIAVVPEPTCMALLALGGLLALCRRRVAPRTDRP